MEFRDTASQIEGIKEIFADAKREDNWNLDEPMLYSFYFVDEDAEKLDKLGEKLEADGYDFIGIYELGDDETEEATGEFLLHIDKTETHTPESLAARNVEFQTLADRHEIKTYDGWEFGEEGVYDDDDEDEDVEVESPS